MTASVSIIIPTHDRVDFIADAVASVLDQGVARMEVIVVDDGSTDGSAAMLRERFGDSITVVHQANAGPAAARNTGIGLATAALVAFLDSDDRWVPGTLAHRMQLLDAHPSAELVVGRTQVVHRPGDDESPWVPLGEPVTTRMLGVTLVRRSALDRVGLFDERMRFGEDEDWFLRADELGLRIVPDDLVGQEVRRHETNMTHDDAGRKRALLQLVKNRRDRGRAGGDHDLRRSSATSQSDGGTAPDEDAAD